MDDLVKQAMVKWPNVPACVGWLGLDERGDWYLRDAVAQAVGSFQSDVPGSKGSLLRHDRLVDFIGRNYAVDGQGRWYFQNGPQRVFVELRAAPFVWRVGDAYSGFEVTAHTGERVDALQGVLDEQGWLYLLAQTALGPQLGLVHTQDVFHASEAIEQRRWALEEAVSARLAKRFGYVVNPSGNHRMLVAP